VTEDSWPSVEPPAPAGLPRVEELPVVAHGYDRERVREAFDSFYRHLARLDTTLRALEAVDVFQAQAKELRKELRALRMDGWVQQPWQPYTAAAPRVRTGLPEAVPRMAIETVFIIAVAVGAYEANLRPLVLAGVMALAVLIVGVVEWAAARERAAPAPARPVEPEAEAPAADEVAAAPLPAAEPWEAPARAVVALPEPMPEPEPEEQTAIAAPAPQPEPEPEPEPEAVEEAELAEELEPAPEPVFEGAEEPVAAEEPEPEPEPEPAPEPVFEAVEEPMPAEEPEPAPPEPMLEAVEEPAASDEPEPDEEPEPAPEPVLEAVEQPEPAEEQEPVEEEPEPEPELAPAAEANGAEAGRRRWWRRARRDEEQPEEFAVPPRHVRVLPSDGGAREPAHHVLDPWEEDFDLSLEDEPADDAVPEGK
jgi:hypothetical protein